MSVVFLTMAALSLVPCTSDERAQKGGPAKQTASLTRSNGSVQRLLIKNADNGVPQEARFKVKRTGNYGVMIGGKAWVDLSSKGHNLASSAHRPGPEGSGIRKIVIFSLKRGEYRLSFSKAEDSCLPYLITEEPKSAQIAH